jgi:hypothetical protein
MSYENGSAEPAFLGLREVAGPLLLRQRDSARQNQEHPVKCPKCNEAMEQVVFESVAVDRCTGCFGLWFDALEAEDLKKLKQNYDTSEAYPPIVP